MKNFIETATCVIAMSSISAVESWPAIGEVAEYDPERGVRIWVTGRNEPVQDSTLVYKEVSLAFKRYLEEQEYIKTRACGTINIAPR